MNEFEERVVKALERIADASEMQAERTEQIVSAMQSCMEDTGGYDLRAVRTIGSSGVWGP